MSRIADLLRKTRQRARERSPMPAGADRRADHSPQWMVDVDIPWELGGAERSAPPPAPVAPQRPVPPEVAGVVRRLFFSDRADGTAIHRVLFSAVNKSAARTSLPRQIAEGLVSICRGNVCVADLDFRRPTLDRYFGLQGRTGFSDLVMDGDSVFDAVHPSSIPRLSVMTAGTRTVDDVPNLADPEALARMVRSLSRFDSVVALTASLADHRDAIVLGPAFDGVVLVAESGTTDPEAVRAAARALAAADIRLLGTIIDNTPAPNEADHQR